MSTRTYTNPETGEVIDDPQIRPFNELIDTLEVGLSAPLFEGTVW